MATRELGWSKVELARESEDVRRSPYLLGDLGLGGLPQFQGEADVLSYRHMRVEGIILEDHGNVTIARRHLVHDVAAHS